MLRECIDYLHVVVVAELEGLSKGSEGVNGSTEKRNNSRVMIGAK